MVHFTPVRGIIIALMVVMGVSSMHQGIFMRELGLTIELMEGESISVLLQVAVMKVTGSMTCKTAWVLKPGRTDLVIKDLLSMVKKKA
jgi:hypothetical protein